MTHNFLIFSLVALFQFSNFEKVFCQKEPLTFTATADKTEILAGQVLEVTFELKGKQAGDFTPPDFVAAGFKVRGGPSQSSTFSMINGVVNSSVSFTYLIAAKKEGELVIPSATIEVEGEIFSTKPLTIKVLPNPDGEIEDENSEENFHFFELPKPETKPESQPKTKRKTTRI